MEKIDFPLKSSQFLFASFKSNFSCFLEKFSNLKTNFQIISKENETLTKELERKIEENFNLKQNFFQELEPIQSQENQLQQSLNLKLERKLRKKEKTIQKNLILTKRIQLSQLFLIEFQQKLQNLKESKKQSNLKWNESQKKANIQKNLFEILVKNCELIQNKIQDLKNLEIQTKKNVKILKNQILNLLEKNSIQQSIFLFFKNQIESKKYQNQRYFEENQKLKQILENNLNKQKELKLKLNL
ncbi:hypothetical protein M0811_06406 [Anaeramoeba ignava]|uniref:Uncharacterized protein n=1 Tax=Anaeramoeba ignava TaxID=1746090 RepID=A0A9Q0RDB3_ANAIG|nr:hypothetical protein M0811_06406 [Anaeramoeba ignava]